MYKYRLSFTKEAPVKYISHLDLSKLFHRAFRRAGLPVAYSEGFNPHPKISLASALRLGTTSSAEYLDVDLSEEIDPAEVRTRLQNATPAGIDIGEVQIIPQEAPAAMALINAAAYHLSCRKTAGSLSARPILTEILAEEEIIITRNTKNGSKEINIRALIHQADILCEDDDRAVIHVLLAASDQGTGRPEELGMLLGKKGLCASEENISIHRTGLYRLYPNGEIRTPFQVLTRESLAKPDKPAE
jgi:radical SAM-linked protein